MFSQHVMEKKNLHHLKISHYLAYKKDPFEFILSLKFEYNYFYKLNYTSKYESMKVYEISNKLIQTYLFIIITWLQICSWTSPCFFLSI